MTITHTEEHLIYISECVITSCGHFAGQSKKTLVNFSFHLPQQFAFVKETYFRNLFFNNLVLIFGISIYLNFKIFCLKLFVARPL